MDTNSLFVVIFIIAFGMLIRACAISAQKAVSQPTRSRYDILESEIARLQAENAQLAVKAAKTEYR